MVPEPDALDRLLAAADALPDRPALLASKIVLPDGSLDPASLPVPEVLDPDLAVAAVDRRLLALRVASPGSLLVDARRVDRLPATLDLEWTARLIKQGPGLLVPGSVAVRPRPDRRAAVRNLARLVASDALELREKPWFFFRLLEQAISALRA